MKKLLIGIVAVGVLLIAAILIAPSFIDWNAHKKQITALVKEATGRDLAIRGNIDVTILPSPALRVEDVRLASVSGAMNPEMLRLPEARISIAFASLFEGQLAAVVTLMRPVVNLERLRDGRTNWEFSSTATASTTTDETSAGEDGKSGLPLDIKLDSFRIVDGAISYLDAASGTLERIEKLNSDVSFDSLDGPFRVDGTATVRAIPIALKVSTGVVKSDAPLSAIVEVSVPDSESVLRLNGTVAGLDGAPVVTSDVELTSKSAAALFAALTGESMPGALAQALTMQGELSATKDAISLTAVDVELGSARATGEFKADLTQSGKITGAIRAGNLNLDTFLEGGLDDGGKPKQTRGPDSSAPASAAGTPSSNVNQVKAAETAGFTVPDLTAAISAEAGIVQYNGALVRDLSVKIGVENGQIAVEDVSAVLPGSTSFSVTGTVKAVEGNPDLDLALSSSSDNLREMLEWAGLDTGSVPADRLRRFSMSASITGAPTNFTAKDIKVQLDASKLSGGLALVLRDRPAFGLRLVVDRINVDGYLPHGGRDTSIGSVPAAAREGDGKASQPNDTASEAGGIAKLLETLETFDANIDATVKNFIVARTPASDLHVDFTVLNGGLEVRKAEIGDLAGLRGKVQGKLDRTKEKPAIVADYTAEIVDLSRFSRFVENPALMEYRGHGRLASAGKIDGNVDQLAVNSRLEALGMNVSVNGVLTSILEAPAFKLATSVRAPELVQMVRLVDNRYSPAAGKLGPVDLTFQFEGSQSHIKADSITGHAGPVTLHGSASLAMGEPRPKLQAKIATSEISLDLFLPPEQRRRSEVPAVHRVIPAAARAGAAPIGSRWSSEPIDIAVLSALDADIDLEMAVLAKDPYRFKDSKLQIRLQDGKLSLDRFFANFSTGTVTAAGAVVPAKDAIAATLKIDANGVDVSDVIEALKDYQVRLGPVRFGARMSGPVTLTSELNTRGLSEYALVSGLNGSARLTGQLRTDTSSETRQAGAVAGLAGALLGKKVREIRGVTDAVQGTDLLVSAFDGPSTLNGDIAVENGVFTTKNLVLVGRGGRALTAATANLPTWRLDSVTDVTLGQDEDPYVTAQVTGALDDPYLRKVSGTLLRGRPVSPPPSSGQSGSGPGAKDSPARIVSPQEAEQPTPAAKKVKPEDVLKGLLQGLSR